MKNRKSQLLIIFLWMITGYVWGQSDYIKPSCLVVDTGRPCREGSEAAGDTLGDHHIIWQVDGSVIVGDKEVIFTSGIKKYYNDKSAHPIYEHEMILVSPEDFEPPYHKVEKIEKFFFFN